MDAERAWLKKLAAALNGRNDYYGQREDGTGKGPGFLGAVPNPQGGASTELSIGVDPMPPYKGSVAENGRSYDSIPSLVPGLTADELNSVLAGKPTESATRKAIIHALQRKDEGKSPFRGWDENDQSPLPAGFK
jgi:hypothetical protein